MDFKSRNNNLFYWFKSYIVNRPPLVFKFSENKLPFEQDETLRELIIEEFKKETPAKSNEVFKIKGDKYSIKFTRKEGDYYPIISYSENDKPNEDKVVLNPTALENKYGNFMFFDFEASFGYKIFSYSYSLSHYSDYYIRFIDVKTQKTLKEKLSHTNGYMAWSKKNKYIFYIQNPQSSEQGAILKRHEMGTPQANDVSLYEEPDNEFSMKLENSSSGEIIYLHIEKEGCTEIWTLPTDKPLDKFKKFIPRELNSVFEISHTKHGHLITKIRKNHNPQIFLNPYDKFYPELAKEIIFLTPDYKFISLLEFQDFAVFHLVKDCKQRLVIYNLPTKESHEINFNQDIFSLNIIESYPYKDNKIGFEYASYTSPAQRYEYDMGTRQTTKVKSKKQYIEIEEDKYITQRLYATSHDGKQIPISVIMKNNLPLDGNNPMLVIAYGAYGKVLNTRPNIMIKKLLDKDIIIAYAHVRGGGELGNQWHNQGRKLNKKNSFYDFIAVTEHLHKLKYSNPNLTLATGTKEGGLTIAVAINIKPELYRAVVTENPFVDIVRIAKMTNPKRNQEWGNPDNQQEYQYLKSYSPIENVQNVKYPDIYIFSNSNNPIVKTRQLNTWLDKIHSISDKGIRTSLNTYQNFNSNFKLLKDVDKYICILKTLNKLNEK